MPPAADVIIIEYDGIDWPIPLAVALRLGSDRGLIDKVKAMAAVGCVRPAKEVED